MSKPRWHRLCGRRWLMRASGACLLFAFAAIGQAQSRGNTSYEGLWAGTLTIDAMQGVPDDDRDAMSQPIRLEMSVGRRGNVRLFFAANAEQPFWQFSESRPTLQMTDVGGNAVINGVLGKTVFAQSGAESHVYNLTRIDDDTLMVYWTRLVVEQPLGRNADRLEWMLGGLVELKRIDQSESQGF